MCFQVLLKGSCLKIWKQSRSEIPSPNPLLPLGNYSLPVDKLQVCCVCLCLLGYNRWSKACVCWDGCHFLTGSAKCILSFLVQQKHLGSEGGTGGPSFKINVLPRKFHKEEDISFASPRTRNLVQEAENSILHKKHKNVPLYEILWEKCAIVNLVRMIYLRVQTIW